MKTVVMAALQRVRGVVACRGGRGRRDGARKHSEGSRGRRWPRRYGGAAAAALGRVRERKQRRETRERERARGSRGSGWRRGDDAQRRGGQAMQTSRVVAWRARARAPCPSSAYWREEEGDRGGRRRWAGPAGGAGQLGRLQVSGPGGLLSFIFLFCFIFFLFNFFATVFNSKIISNSAKTF